MSADEPRRAAAADTNGLVWGYVIDPAGGVEEVAGDALDHAMKLREGCLWLHFDLSDNRAIRWIERSPDVPEAVRHDLLDQDQRPNIEAAGDGIVGVVADLHYDFAFDPNHVSVVRFYLDDRRIITGRRYPLRAVSALRDAVRQGLARGGSVELAAHLFRCLGDGLQRVVSSIESDVNGIQDRLLDAHDKADRARLAALRRLAVRLDRHFSAARASLVRFCRRPPRWFGDAELGALLGATEDLGLAVGELESVQERCKLLEEEIVARSNEETSRNLYVLSIVTAVFLPLNLVTGIFGMNTGGLPFNQEQPFGTWIVLGGMAVLALASLVFLHRRRLF